MARLIEEAAAAYRTASGTSRCKLSRVRRSRVPAACKALLIAASIPNRHSLFLAAPNPATTASIGLKNSFGEVSTGSVIFIK